MGIRIEFKDEDTQRVLAAAGLTSYEQFIEPNQGEEVWRTGTTVTRRLSIPTATSPLTCYLKAYRYADERWRHRFRKDKAAIEARNYCILREQCRVPVPDVLAHGARRRGIRLIDAFILTRAIEHTRTLDQFADSIRRESRSRANLLEQSADLVRHMHDAEFYHVDLQWRNLLVQQVPGRVIPKLFVIDSPRGGRRRWGPSRAYGRLRDLSSLAKGAAGRLTRAEQIRWLCYYFGVARLKPELREFVYAIQRDRRSKDRPPEDAPSPS